MTDLDDVRTVVTGATILAQGIGASIALAVLGAMWEAAFPGMPTRVGMTMVSAISAALRLMVLVSGLVLAYRLVVTYVHVGGRRARHRYSRVKAWREGTYTAEVKA